MSVISVSEAKIFLSVIHNYDDLKILEMLESSEDEAAKFLNVDSLNEWSELPWSIFIGVMLLLQSNYQASPDDIPKLRAAAETKLMPYRVEMGV